MRFWWFRRRGPSPETKEAERKADEAQERLDLAKKDETRINDVTNRLNHKNRRNHFGEIIAETMRRAGN